MQPLLREISVLVLGDSYSIGEGVSPSDSWPAQLTELLFELFGVESDVQVIAQTGWTTRDLLEATHELPVPKKGFDLVTLLIGVNNQYQGLPIQDYTAELDQLLARAIHWCKSSQSVLVLSIPDYGHTPYGKSHRSGVSQEIDLFNDVKEKQALKAGVSYVDITDLSRREGGLAPDELHPSPEQYTSWVERMLPQVQILLDLT